MGFAEACATFDIRWVGVDVLRLKGCVTGANLYGGGTIALLTHRSPLNTKGDDAADRKIRNLRSGELLAELETSTSQRWDNPCWWGHALTKGQSDLVVIEWVQRGGRRWPHRVQMRSPLLFGVGARHPLKGGYLFNELAIGTP